MPNVCIVGKNINDCALEHTELTMALNFNCSKVALFCETQWLLLPEIYIFQTHHYIIRENFIE